MDFTNEQLVDVGINIAGYLAAGAFWLVIYSAWQGRRQRVRATKPQAATAPAPAVSERGVEPTAARNGSAGEFMSLSATSGSEPMDTKQPADASATGRRDRTAVFALARKMIVNGVSADMIKKTVPISDGELALLTGNN